MNNVQIFFFVIAVDMVRHTALGERDFQTWKCLAAGKPSRSGRDQEQCRHDQAQGGAPHLLCWFVVFLEGAERLLKRKISFQKTSSVVEDF